MKTKHVISLLLMFGMVTNLISQNEKKLTDEQLIKLLLSEIAYKSSSFFKIKSENSKLQLLYTKFTLIPS